MAINVNIKEYEKFFVTWEYTDFFDVGVPDPTPEMIAQSKRQIETNDSSSSIDDLTEFEEDLLVQAKEFGLPILQKLQNFS